MGHKYSYPTPLPIAFGGTGNTTGGSGGGPPTGAAGGDLAGTYPNPTVVATGNVETIIRANRLDQFAAPTAPVAFNAQKITGLANGSGAQDAAAFGQIPAALPPNGSAGGDLGSTYPNPQVLATHLSAPLPIAQGGTASATQNFVDLTTAQTVAGVKTFSSAPVVPAASFPESAVINLTTDLAAKAADAAVVHNTGAETVAGIKTFSSAPVVPAASFPESAVTNLTTDLAAKATDSLVAHLAGTETITGNKTFSGTTTVATPVNATDAATKGYADSLIANLQLKKACQYTTNAALPSNVYNAGAGTLTGVGFGALTPDGTAMTVGQRLLVKNEVTAANNGIYDVTAVGAVAAVYILTRSSDMNTGAEVPGAQTVVELGTGTNPGSAWIVSDPGPFTLGTTAINWSALDIGPSLVQGDGITVTGETIAVNNTVVRTTRNIIAGTGLTGGGVLSADRTLTVDPTATRLDQWAAPTASVAFNAQKITGLANGTASTDGAAFGQIPVVDSTATDIKPVGTQAAGATGKWADAGHVHPGSAATITSTNATWPIPAGATLLRVTCNGAGGGGGGGGSATTSGGVTTQQGGGAGAAGAASTQIVSVGANTTLAVTIGAGGALGAGGAANNNPGVDGSVGGDTTVTGTGISVTGKGGGQGRGALGNSTTAANGGVYGMSGSTGNAGCGNGGKSASIGGSPASYSPGGGGGGGQANATLGGLGGGAGTAIAGGAAGTNNGSGTTAGGNATNATVAGSGGGGGGGGSLGGAGGNGANGANGFVIIEVIG